MLSRLIRVGRKALAGDSNDDEHSALYDIVTELEFVQGSGQTGEVEADPAKQVKSEQVKSASRMYSIRNHTGRQIGNVETAGDAIEAYARKLGTNAERLLDAGYTAVPMDETGEVATSPVTQSKEGCFSYSIRNHLGHEVGTVETHGDAIAAYACKANADSAKLRAAGYKAVPMHSVAEPGECPDCYGTGYEEIDHGHYPCPRACLPKQVKSGETGEVKTGEVKTGEVKTGEVTETGEVGP